MPSNNEKKCALKDVDCRLLKLLFRRGGVDSNDFFRQQLKIIDYDCGFELISELEAYIKVRFSQPLETFFCLSKGDSKQQTVSESKLPSLVELSAKQIRLKLALGDPKFIYDSFSGDKFFRLIFHRDQKPKNNYISKGLVFKLFIAIIYFNADDINDFQQGFTRLHLASLLGHFDCVKMLISLNINSNLLTKHTQVSALYIAAEYARPKIVEILYESNSKISQRQSTYNKTALCAAVEANCFASTYFLIRKARADVNIVYRNVYSENCSFQVDTATPLLMAVLNGNKEIAYLLKTSGAKPFIMDGGIATIPHGMLIHILWSDHILLTNEFLTWVDFFLLKTNLNPSHILELLASKRNSDGFFYLVNKWTKDGQDFLLGNSLSHTIRDGELKITKFLLARGEHLFKQELRAWWFAFSNGYHEVFYFVLNYLKTNPLEYNLNFLEVYLRKMLFFAQHDKVLTQQLLEVVEISNCKFSAIVNRNLLHGVAKYRSPTVLSVYLHYLEKNWGESCFQQFLNKYLRVATRNNSKPMAVLLLTYGAEIVENDSERSECINIAASQGFVAMMNLFLHCLSFSGCPSDRCLVVANNALLTAVKNSQLTIILSLTAKNSEFDKPFDTNSMLSSIAHYSKLHIVKYFITPSAISKLRNCQQQKILLRAASGNKLSVISYLLNLYKKLNLDVSIVFPAFKLVILNRVTELSALFMTIYPEIVNSIYQGSTILDVAIANNNLYVISYVYYCGAREHSSSLVYENKLALALLLDKPKAFSEAISKIDDSSELHNLYKNLCEHDDISDPQIRKILYARFLQLPSDKLRGLLGRLIERPNNAGIVDFFEREKVKINKALEDSNTQCARSSLAPGKARS